MPTEEDFIYQIVILGELDPTWSEWLNGFTMSASRSSEGICTTVLSGPIRDQSALRGVLARIWDLNLELVALNRVR
jgi:hypothetical protein